MKTTLPHRIVVALVVCIAVSAAALTPNSSKPQTVAVKDLTMGKGGIGISEQTRCRRLSSFCLDSKDRFLACDEAGKRIRVITIDDKLVEDWKLAFAPQVIACCDDSSVLVAGSGKIALLNERGQAQITADLPDKAKLATAVGASGKDIFVCVQLNMGYAIYRLDEKLQNPVPIIKGLRGCCGQMDFKVHDGNLYVAHNVAFKVEKYDRTGKLLSSFGKRGNDKPEFFWGCCEPKNLFFDSNGNLYTSESENHCVKKFTATGKYLDTIGTVSSIGGCRRVTIACTRDNRFFMIDTPHDLISPVQSDKVGKF